MIYQENNYGIFFTSDTHFSQERTLTFSCRPFENVREMDQYIIDQWNSVVDPDDIVYHLGDFGNANICEQLNGRIKLVLGNYEYNPDKNILVTEYSTEISSELTKIETQLTDSAAYNYDRLHEYQNFMKESFGFNEIIFPEDFYSYAAHNKNHVPAVDLDHFIPALNTSVADGLYLAHVPSEIEKVSKNKDFEFGLFGHIHKLQMVRRYGLNVGIDCHNFMPVSLDQVLFYKNAIQNHYDNEVFGD